MSKNTKPLLFMNLTEDTIDIRVNGSELEITKMIALALSKSAALKEAFRLAIRAMDNVENAERNN